MNKPIEQQDMEYVMESFARDLPLYCRTCLQIRTKTEALQPLKLNSAQAYLHRRLERQLSSKGMVRALILKGRQQGISTYVQARYFHKTSFGFGRKAFILTHEDKASANIFEIGKRYCDRLPPLVRPEIKASNAKEIVFSGTDSSMTVATAGTKDTGRSDTVQYFHGSEVAKWPHAERHSAGAMQAVPDDIGTEIILETTSGGPQGLFFDYWQDAKHGRGDYEAIFIPWFWQEEYRKPCEEDFEPTAEEECYAQEHGLDVEQIRWRRGKVTELRGVHNFRREYPATPEEAFSAEQPGALWIRELIHRNRAMAAPLFRSGAISLDPSTTSKKTSDAWGAVWGGEGMDGHVYVLGDNTRICTPQVAATNAIRTVNDEDLDFVVYESNQGGDMVPTIIHLIDASIICKGVHASTGKRARAEPVHALYEEGMVHHVGELAALEDEMCTWDASTSNESPNRLDALVYLIWYFKLKKKAAVSLKLRDPDVGWTGSKWDV